MPCNTIFHIRRSSSGSPQKIPGVAATLEFRFAKWIRPSISQCFRANRRLRIPNRIRPSRMPPTLTTNTNRETARARFAMCYEIPEHIRLAAISRSRSWRHLMNVPASAKSMDRCRSGPPGIRFAKRSYSIAGHRLVAFVVALGGNCRPYRNTVS